MADNGKKKVIAGLGEMLADTDLLLLKTQLIERARPLIDVSTEAGDALTADFVTGRLEEHEKTAWMLRATLG